MVSIILIVVVVVIVVIFVLTCSFWGHPTAGGTGREVAGGAAIPVGIAGGVIEGAGGFSFGGGDGGDCGGGGGGGGGGI